VVIDTKVYHSDTLISK